MRFALTLSLLLAACTSPSATFPSPPAGMEGGTPPAAGEDPGSGPGPELELGDHECIPTGFAQENHPFDKGEGVELSGTIEYSGTAEGQYLVDLMNMEIPDQPQVAYNVICHHGGEFLVEVPTQLGKLIAVAFLDTDGMGPANSKAAGTSAPFEVGTDAVSDITIKLEDGADMSRYIGATLPTAETTGEAPVEGEVPPPEGEAPVEGEAPLPEGEAPPAGPSPEGDAPPVEPPSEGAIP